jgi:hypothetical protein
LGNLVPQPVTTIAHLLGNEQHANIPTADVPNGGKFILAYAEQLHGRTISKAKINLAETGGLKVCSIGIVHP